MGNGEEALRHLQGFIDYPLVRANSLYAESGPVLETPLSAAQSVLDMLLQSWGDKIRVFPSVPAAWSEATFHNLLAQGAFLVSAGRKGGRTTFISITSLAGEPLRVQADFDGPVEALSPSGAAISFKEAGKGVYDILLPRGESCLLAPRGRSATPVAEPLPAQPGRTNWYGLNANREAMKKK